GRLDRHGCRGARDRAEAALRDRAREEHGRGRHASRSARSTRRYRVAVARLREPRHVPRLSRARRAIRPRCAGAAALTAAVVALAAIGTIMVTSASVSIVDGEPLHYLMRHLGALAVGLLGLAL